MPYPILKPEIIANMAKSDEPIPDDFELSQICLYTTMQCLYCLYRLGKITVSDANKRKQIAFKKYIAAQMLERLYNDNFEIRKKLCASNASKAAYTGSCNNCKTLIKIFDGFSIREDDTDGL